MDRLYIAKEKGRATFSETAQAYGKNSRRLLWRHNIPSGQLDLPYIKLNPYRWGEFSYKQTSLRAAFTEYPHTGVKKHRIMACLVTSSNPVSPKTRRVGQRYTLNLSRAETSSRWCGVVVRRGSQVSSTSLDHGSKGRRQKPSCS
ncbi:hypothetical protein TNCV_4414981 [Trichonephila clavipes]|uniref:Uncharacterized protein n=1 Tax=Trichonephila clavipes TaxID=2585209 RepID=A0A8X6S4C2_TRICX|nr:hypothetical protein TNCV_4414981 [Trichonephila clavipes]